MQQYGPKIRYDISRTPVTMFVANAIRNTVEDVFRENSRLELVDVYYETDVTIFTFADSVEPEEFLTHLNAVPPEHYGSV